jgi:hypothetical protein
MNNKTIYSTIAVVAIVLMATIIPNVFASGKGLRVFLDVNTNLAAQDVKIITTQFDQRIQTHDGYMNNGYTQFELEYNKGMIQNGKFNICVHAPDAGIQECINGYNSEAKKPEYLSVNLDGSNMPQPQDQSQSQSSNSENTNDNALNQSQETTIYICKENGCFPQ